MAPHKANSKALTIHIGRMLTCLLWHIQYSGICGVFPLQLKLSGQSNTTIESCIFKSITTAWRCAELNAKYRLQILSPFFHAPERQHVQCVEIGAMHMRVVHLECSAELKATSNRYLVSISKVLVFTEQQVVALT